MVHYRNKKSVTALFSYFRFLLPASCSGSCRYTCTGDGRKIDDLVGYGGSRAVVREDNLLCQSSDPYRGTLNVLCHEFGHTINFRALNNTHNTAVSLSLSGF